MKTKYIILTSVLALFAVLFLLMLSTESGEVDKQIQDLKSEDTKAMADEKKDTIFITGAIKKSLQGRSLYEAEQFLSDFLKGNIRKFEQGRGKTGEPVRDSIVYEYTAEDKILFSTKILKPISRIVLRRGSNDPEIRTRVSFIPIE